MDKKKYKVWEPEEAYGENIQLALSIALVLIILLFFSVRTLEVTPYKPKSEVATILEELPPELEEIEEPPPPPKPQIPVEVEESEEVEEEEIEFAPTTEFNELEAPPPPKVEETYEFFAVEVKPNLVKKVEPEYPEFARMAGIEGKVFIKALVDEEGNVIDIQVLKADNEVFIEPAKKAAMQFKFTPGYQRDRPVKVWVSIPFSFRLTK